MHPCVCLLPLHSVPSGFIEFAQYESAVSAIEQYDRKPLDDSPQLMLQFAKPKGSSNSYLAARTGPGANTEGPVRLFVSNIGSGTTVEQVRTEFERFGRVTDCSVWPNVKASARMDGSRPMSAHVEFTNAAEAKAAMDALRLRPVLRGTEEQQQLAAKEAGQEFHVTPPLIVDVAKPRGSGGGGRREDDYYRPRNDDYYRPRGDDYYHSSSSSYHHHHRDDYRSSRRRSPSPPPSSSSYYSRRSGRDRDDYYRRSERSRSRDRGGDRDRERERDRDRERERERDRSSRHGGSDDRDGGGHRSSSRRDSDRDRRRSRSRERSPLPVSSSSSSRRQRDNNSRSRSRSPPRRR
jgi:hypothetical protein